MFFYAPAETHPRNIGVNIIVVGGESHAVMVVVEGSRSKVVVRGEE